MRRQYKELISLFLAVAIVIQACPFYVSAIEYAEADDIAILETVGYEVSDARGDPSEIVVGEVTSLREENVKHFKMEDGSFFAVNYGLPVHYSTDGETWEDIDNTLTTTASGGGDVSVMSQEQTSFDYTAENGDRTTTFSSDLSEGFLFSSSCGQVGIRFSLPGDSTETNEDEIVTEDSIVELVPIESEPQNPSSEEEQESTSVTPETEASEEPAEETVEATEEASEETTEATTEATEEASEETTEATEDVSEETTEATEETEEQEEDATVATVEQTEVTSEENNEANPEMPTSPAENEEITYVDDTTATATGTTEPDAVIQEPVQTEESPITIEGNPVEENTESLDGEDVTASDNTEEGPDMSEPETESDPTEGTESETETQPIEEMPTEATEPDGTTETIPSATDGEDISSEITEGDVTEPTEESVSVEETEPSQESTAPTVPSDNTEETVFLDETIPPETEEVITETEEITNEETDFEIRQFDRTVVAQISYPNQEGTEVTTGNTSTMGIQQGDSISDEENPNLMDQIYPEKLRTNILYEDVYPGVDLLYEMYSVHVKESIIVKEKLDDYVFSFEINLNGLTPILQDSGQIVLVDDDETVIYRMPAPFMYDNAGAESDEVAYSIEEIDTNLWKLTVTADPEWINADETEFPVIIDPTLIEDMSSDQFVHSLTSEYTYDVTEKTNIACGYHANSSDGSTYGQVETYFRVSLPEIAPGNTVVRAYVNFNQNDFEPKNGAELIVYMSEITEPVALGSERPDLDGDGDGDLLWADRPDISDTYLDYALLSWTETQDDNIRWDVTAAAKGWYEGEPNYGLAMTSNGNATTKCRAWFTYNSQAVFIVAYRNTIGVEPYYTYQTLDVGKAGTAYIGDFSGNLTVNKQLVYYASAINPVSIELNYNSFYPANYDVANSMGYGMNIGYSMQFNLMQRIDVPTIEEAVTSYLRWTDGDGTQHYFAKDLTRDNIYFYDEDGLGLKIKILSSVNKNYEMSDDDGNTMTFTNGLLTSIKDANGNQIKINLSSGKITSVTQLNNTANPQEITIATFSYNDTNTLTEMVDAAGNQLLFTYSGGYLVSIKKPSEVEGEEDEAIMRYSVPSGVMNYAIDLEVGYGIAFAYANGMVSEYWEINEATNYPDIPPVSGSVVVVNHASNGLVKYRHCGVDQAVDSEEEGSKDDVITCYTFDYAGRSVNCYTTDAENNIVGATNVLYSGIGNTDKRNNRVMRTVSSGAIPQQIYVNGGFEYPGGWTGTGVSRSDEKPRTGLKSLRVTQSGGSATTSPWITNSIGEPGRYTVSAYINTESAVINNTNDAGVYILIKGPNNNQVAKTNAIDYTTSSDIDNGWVRIADSFEVTADNVGIYTVQVCVTGVSGVAYIDDVYLEKSDAPSNVNLIENSNFINNYVDWTGTNLSWGANQGLHGNGIRVSGSATEGNHAVYAVPINLMGTQTYVLSGWAKADAVPSTAIGNTREKAFGLRARVIYTDKKIEEYHYVPFNPDVHTWQYASLAIVPKHPDLEVETIKVVCAYETNLNTAWFDDISLVREPAQTMTYDENGELISVVVSNSANEEYSYEGSNLTAAVTEGQGTFNYTYDSNNNLLSASNGILTQNYTYSTKGGMVTGTTLSGTGTEKMTSSATYSGDGNQVLSVTDTRGKTTYYLYEGALYQQHGLATQVTNPGGTVKRSIYTKEGLPDSEYIASTVSLDYTYNNGRLSNVERGGWLPGESGATHKVKQFYNIAYDSMGRLKQIGVDGALRAEEYINTSTPYLLVTNTYDAIGFLKQQALGNGGTISYGYDSLGRTKSMTKPDGTGAEYFYSSDGKLSRVEYGTATYRYLYDSLDRLIYSDWLSGINETIQTFHEYDTSNRLTKQTINLVDNSYAQEYTYDDYGRIIEEALSADGFPETTVDIEYDDMSRFGTITTPVAEVEYSYADGATSGTTTNLVEEIAYSAANGSSLGGIRFEYDYDAMGNISSYYDSHQGYAYYTYDPQGQLTAVNVDGLNLITYSYEYDTYGNIREKTTVSGGTTETHSYSYLNYYWKDLLSKYDGVSISYDSSGNPLAYYNGTHWDFSWNGRELKNAITDIDEDTYRSIEYTYDMNGLRTGKTVSTNTYREDVYHAYTATVVAATCTTGGYTEYVCSCGESYQDSIVDALGHDYDVTVIEGVNHYLCARCGDAYADHTHTYTHTIIQPTCLAGGYTLHECACGYSYQNNETEAMGHSYDVTIDDRCRARYRCYRCGDFYIETVHNYERQRVDATCTEYGYYANICRRCGDVEDNLRHYVIRPLGHDFRETFTGSGYYVCTRCQITSTTPDASSNDYALSTSLVAAAASEDECRTEQVILSSEMDTYSYIYAGGKLIRQTVTKTVNGSAVGTTVIDFVYDYNGNPYALMYNNAMYYYITNAQGDVIAIVDSSGNNVAYYAYDPYGNVVSSSGALAEINPLRYRGYYYDSETGFYYVSSRYYDPAIGRFINADDPSYLAANGDFISYNLFAYCGNNPVTRTDTNGNAWHLAIGAAIGIGTQLLSDVLTGSTSSLSDYAIAAVGGALAASSISTIGSVIANGALGGAAYLANCESQGTTANSLDFILAVGIGAVSGAIGGSGANGTKLKGVYKTSRVMLDSVVSQTKQAMYTAKIKQVTNTIVESVTRTVIAGVSSNYLNIGRRNITDSLI